MAYVGVDHGGEPLLVPVLAPQQVDLGVASLGGSEHRGHRQREARCYAAIAAGSVITAKPPPEPSARRSSLRTFFRAWLLTISPLREGR